LERLDNEISKAMRLDLDGELDANKIESVRATIDDGLSRLHERLDKVKKKSKSRRKKKAEFSPEMIKSAQKITGVQGVFVTVDLLTSRIARVCINGMVSAGHDIEDLYKRQVSKYKLNDREQAQVMQLLADMGYPLRQDRGYLADEDVDTTSSDNFDWAANYRS
jgi:transposase